MLESDGDGYGSDGRGGNAGQDGGRHWGVRGG